ncbi:ABC-type iron(III) transport system, periplasmic component [Thermococcus sp. 4557]|uniref:ABC transporter substrate-binding protein n=1 Tax=Thermococcus sp. (strain CGMCC 1.5172 / 4557) TaxID=1042877 RepID=UPI000219EBA1|nr:extracellular solute-binding protein [Thermococcus sp. 4557]AEK74005.1 ABC-type iron(III) transport system, periplasmic component [Thermococcus sp. 4557]
MKKPVAIGFILLLALSVVASGCISGGNGGETSGITLVIVTRHDATIQYMVKQTFLQSDVAKQYNIEDIKFIKVPESLWPSYIEKGADVGWGGGPTLFDDLYKANYLAPITDEKVLGLLGNPLPTELAGMPMVRKDDDGKVYWIAAALSSFGYTVNKKQLEKWNLQIPDKWEDIASEDWALNPPQYGIADPTRSTSNTRIYQIILQAFGWEEGWRIMTLITANSKVYLASDAVRDAVINGEIAAGNTIDFYGYTAMQQNPDCLYVVPKGESIINGDPIALLKNAKHPEAAQAFIYWVLTEGQAVWMSPDVNRLPINPQIFDMTITKPYADVIFKGQNEGKTYGEARPALEKAYDDAIHAEGIEFDDKRALETVSALQYYFKATLVDPNQKLHDAWVAIVQAHKQGKITDEQFEQLKDELTAPIEFKDPETGQTVTFTEEYAKKINDRIVKDRNFQDQLVQEWRQGAMDKYQKVLDDLNSMLG